jgi:hypothetical protein
MAQRMVEEKELVMEAARASWKDELRGPAKE